ncbi:MAG: hypothetical protein ACYS5V_13550, partial [Planctomycetota bacterium]
MVYHINIIRRRRRARRGTRRAIAYVLALWLLATFASMAIAFTSVTALEIRKAENLRWQGGAQMAAESGIAYLAYQLMIVRLPGGTTQADMVASLTTALGQLMDGTANLGAESVTNLGSSVHVPSVSLGGDASFMAWMIPLTDTRCVLVVNGEAGGFRKAATVEVELVPALARAFDYGMASRGSVQVYGNTQIIGVNDPSEASVFSDHGGSGAILLSGGSVNVAGNLYVSGDETSVTLEGNPCVGGTNDPGEIMEDVQHDVMAPDFPELDTAPLTALATNLVDSSTDTTTSGLVFNNIRIAAGTNPTFASDTQINGVVYVEAPNIVSFEGHATINGLIVTEDSDAGMDACQINFAGTVDATGVDALPDTEEFATVKEHTGTFLLAPGFKVTFT